MRADALQNRQRLLDAADAMFREHGIDVGVAEIADAAGLGRGTLFRNFSSKDHLIVAVVSARMQDAIDAGRELLRTHDDDAELLFVFIEEIVARQQANRALMDAISDEFFAYPETLAAHDALLELLDQLLERGKRADSVRPEVGAMDVLTLVKGVCLNPLALDGSPDVILRHLDLIRAAITTPAFSRPLRGSSPPVPEHATPARVAPGGLTGSHATPPDGQSAAA
jgi:AcrR family transcriptional regulator